MDNIYGLNKSIKSFAVANDFVINTNKACYKLGQNLQPFCIYGNETQEKFNVIDFSKFTGFVDQSKSLLDEIVDYRREVFKNFGLGVDTSQDIKKRLLFFDYLMSISICYVEVPKYVTKDGLPMTTFDKFLCTRNPAIMAAWMGTQPNEMQAKYSPRIQYNQIEFDDNQVKFVKLNHTAKGNSITVPRNKYAVENMTCIPLYMLYAFIEGFKPLLQSNIVKFKYLKDNGTVRELASTLNKDILMDYYNDSIFVGTMLQGVDINSVQQGGMTLSSKMNRGYIKVPEVGSSIYDGTGVRSLNVARLLSAEIVSEVDRSFIHVDLNSVITNFKDSIDYIVRKNPEYLVDIYKNVTGVEPDSSEVAVLVTKLYDYVDSRGILLSTTFYRSLHLFMVNNPIWFPCYTGKPAQTVVSSQNFGVVQMDF